MIKEPPRVVIRMYSKRIVPAGCRPTRGGNSEQRVRALLLQQALQQHVACHSQEGSCRSNKQVEVRTQPRFLVLRVVVETAVVDKTTEERPHPDGQEGKLENQENISHNGAIPFFG